MNVTVQCFPQLIRIFAMFQLANNFTSAEMINLSSTESPYYKPVI